MSAPLVRRVTNDGRKYKNKRQRTSGSFKLSNKRRMSSILPKEHVFERTTLISVPVWTNSGIGASVNATAGAGYGMAFEFSLTQLLMNIGNGAISGTQAVTYQGYTEFTALFDEYKILNAKIKMMFTNNNSSVNSPSTALPEFLAITDQDDSTPPADIYAVMQYQKIQIKQLGQANDPLKRTVYPKPLVQTYRTSVTTGYSTPPAPIWIDVNQADVPHYGCKMVFNNINNQTAVDTKLGKIDIYCTQRFVMKTVR